MCTGLEKKQAWPGKEESYVPNRIGVKGEGSSVFPFKDFYFHPWNKDMHSFLGKNIGSCYIYTIGYSSCYWILFL